MVEGQSHLQIPNLRTSFTLAVRDRFRKFTNMLGDCIGVAVVQHLCRNELQISRPIEACLVEENRVTSSN